MSSQITPELLQKRSAALNAAAASVKAHFVGIDSTIDDLIDAMRVWYLMPEALMRPVIINLWGMTGVGKTDLIRKLVVALSMQDRFVEIELANNDETKWYSSVTSILNQNNLNDESPKILLFDEIQRFRMLDHEGNPVEGTKFADFWELLSDGQLSKREHEDLSFLIAELKESQRGYKRPKKKDKTPPPVLSIYDAQQLQKTLSMPEGLNEIMAMPHDKLLHRLEQARVTKQVFEPVNHSKTLIIISGNLDDAFSMATRIDEADVDADIFSAFTEKVTLVDVKQALAKRFRPEQVARFGNIHLIYRSLRREHFEELIAREVHRIEGKMRALFNLEITVTDSVLKLIYRNGVFPVQGVRPVFSSIGDIVETHLSKLVLDAMLNGPESSITLHYHELDSQMVAQFSSGKITRTPFVGRLDQARQSNREDVVSNVSVHECGHALAYVLLFGLAPLQLVARVASPQVSGFTFPHSIHETRLSLLKKIKVYLAGGIAEEVIFGVQDASTGRLSDREQASALLIDYVRRYGFDDHFHTSYALTDEHAMGDHTSVHIEKMMTRLVHETYQLLVSNKALLLELSRKLFNAGRLQATEVAAITKDHGIPAQVRPEGFLVVPPYHRAIQQKT